MKERNENINLDSLALKLFNRQPNFIGEVNEESNEDEFGGKRCHANGHDGPC